MKIEPAMISLITSFKIADQKDDLLWITSGQNAGPHKKIRNVFFLVESNLSRPEEVFPHCFGRPYNVLVVTDDGTTVNMDPCYMGFLQNLCFQGRWPPSHYDQLNPSTGISIQLAGALPYLPGVPYGPTGEFAFTQVIKQRLLFCLPRAQKFPGL